MPALSPVQQKFVLHWGEMGTRWGINRTVAQIHALLFISPVPLNAEDIADTLTVARSNVSTSLKELQAWGIVRLVHVMGDKRDHFEHEGCVGNVPRGPRRTQKREVDPMLTVLRDCIIEAEKDKQADEHTEAKLRELLEFFETTTGWYQQVRALPTPALTRFMKLGDKARKALGLGE